MAENDSNESLKQTTSKLLSVFTFRRLKERLNTNKEILWANIFNSTIESSPWLKYRSLSPGRWAVGYAGLYIIYRVLNDTKPASILEFGLGESTKITSQYILSQLEKSLVVIEQDQNWLSYFSNEILDVKPYTKVLPIKKELVHGKLTNVYTDLIENINDKKYDFIIIDGPWGTRHYSRSQILNIAEADLLADKFIIIMDDYNRKGERQTIKALKKILDKKQIKYTQGIYKGIKETLILCSPDYQFLATL